MTETAGLTSSAAPAPLTRSQRLAILAAWLGWTLDAFDFFLMVMLVKAVADAFHTDVKAVSEALFFTLAARPVGALLFGGLAERYGRRPVLMAVILLFSALSLASGLARSLGELLVLRAAFGVAMGGEWGVGASLCMESIPARLRGRVSGLLQSGYPTGYLLAALAFYLLFDRIGWRGMFMLGVAPALLVALIRSGVEESPAHVARMGLAGDASRTLGGSMAAMARDIARHRTLALYLVVLMAAMTMLSHGTQDLYPTFLQKQHHFDTAITGRIVAFMNIGAIIGTFAFGTLSERLGRRRVLIFAAVWSLAALPLWSLAQAPLWLAIGAFLMQAGVQGAWSVIPAHLNELSPTAIRAMFPGFVYQLGNLVTARNAVWQANIAQAHDGNFALALAGVAGVTCVVLIVWTAIGPEKRGIALA